MSGEYDTEDLTDCAENAEAELCDMREWIRLGDVTKARAVAKRMARDLPPLVEFVNEYLERTGGR